MYHQIMYILVAKTGFMENIYEMLWKSIIGDESYL